MITNPNHIKVKICERIKEHKRIILDTQKEIQYKCEDEIATIIYTLIWIQIWSQIWAVQAIWPSRTNKYDEIT